jgi:hypothetical protein
MLVNEFDPNCRSNNKFCYALVHVGLLGQVGLLIWGALQISRFSIPTTNDGMTIGIMEARDKTNTSRKHCKKE